MHEQNYDAIIIGAGLGGMLSAAQLLDRKKRILILERLPHCGGRFTAKTYQGVQLSTGAVHMVPFGSSGVLARMLRHLHIPHTIFDADVFGSFHVHGKQYRSRGLLGTMQFLGPRQFALLVKIGYLMFLKRLPEHELNSPFIDWLAGRIDIRRNRELVAFFASISGFALSLGLQQVSTAEVSAITKNMFSFGAPGIVAGGCGALTQTLESHLREQGADLRLRCDVVQILHENDHVTGVRVRDKTDASETLYSAPLVVSDIGPRATSALLHNQQITQAQVLKKEVSGAEQETSTSLKEAIGLKIHILSDVSLIPHKGIMYCLDTQRIAGMVQPTNFDASLAPQGKHLLISHQVVQSDTIEEEKALALADLRMMFGESFDKHCRILTTGVYRGEWPVNRIAQGEDVSPETALHGLYMVGDAVKPTGYLMVEGVAQSVNQFLDLLDIPPQDQKGRMIDDAPGKHHPRNVIPPPSRLNAVRWLWEAPGNS